MDKAREARKRRGLRTAIRIAGLVGLVATGVGWQATQADAADDPTGPMKVPYAKGCCDFGGMWGPPAPCEMTGDALERLRAAEAA